MKSLLLCFFLMMLLVIPAASEPLDINNASTMPELVAAINNGSVIDLVSGYYTIYEPIRVTTDNFTISENTRIDTHAFLDLNSNVLGSDCELRGFESGRKPRTDSRFITSGYMIVRNDLTLSGVYARGLGSEHKPAEYNEGIMVFGNSTIENSTFEYVRSITMVSLPISIETPPGSGMYITIYTNTTNGFKNNTFKRTKTIVQNSVNVDFVDCVFDNSKVHAHNYDDNNNPGGVSLDRCTFTDTNTRQAGDGHYSGIYGVWANINVSNSTFYDCDIRSGDRPVHVLNCTTVNGDIVLSAARTSTIKDSTIHGSIQVSRSGSKVVINGNDISNSDCGIQIGTEPKYGQTAIDEMTVSNNKIHNTTVGIAVLYASGRNAHIMNNSVHNTTITLHTKYNKRSNWQTMIHGNTFNGDVRIGNKLNLYNNLVSGTMFIDDSLGDIIIKNNTAQIVNLTNSINVKIGDCSVEMYNLNDNSSHGWITSGKSVNVTVDNTIHNISVSNATYVFNNRSCITHTGLNFTVHSGNLSSINTTGLNGTYDLMKDSAMFIENVSENNGCLLFIKTMTTGNYSIVPHETIATTGQQKAIEPDQHGWRIHTKEEHNNTTRIDNRRDEHIKIIKTDKVEKLEQRTIKHQSVFMKIINWILNLFR